MGMEGREEHLFGDAFWEARVAILLVLHEAVGIMYVNNASQAHVIYHLDVVKVGATGEEAHEFMEDLLNAATSLRKLQEKLIHCLSL